MYMPYKRRSYRKRRTGRKASGWMSTAARALKLAKWAAAMLNPELKSKDILVAPGSTTGGLTGVTLLSQISQGTNTYERVGDSVRLKSFYFTGAITQNPAEVQDVRVRMALVVDRYYQGTLPTYGEVFAAHNGSLSTAASLDNPLNVYNYPGRFHVLSDKMYTLQTTEGGPSIKSFEIYRKLKKFHLKFDGSSSSGNVRGNVIYLVWSVGGNAVPTNYPYWNYNFRMRYVDN